MAMFDEFYGYNGYILLLYGFTSVTFAVTWRLQAVTLFLKFRFRLLPPGTDFSFFSAETGGSGGRNRAVAAKSEIEITIIMALLS